MSETFDAAQLQQLGQSLARLLADFRWPGSPQPADIPAQHYLKALRIAIKSPQTPAYLGLALLTPPRPRVLS